MQRVPAPTRFPFLFGGTFIEAGGKDADELWVVEFPFLFGGTFIEAGTGSRKEGEELNFPSFSEGLSLRRSQPRHPQRLALYFPSFSEGLSLRPDSLRATCSSDRTFPFLFGGTFIEAPGDHCEGVERLRISLPFRRDFH